MSGFFGGGLERIYGDLQPLTFLKVLHNRFNQCFTLKGTLDNVFTKVVKVCGVFFSFEKAPEQKKIHTFDHESGLKCYSTSSYADYQRL